MDDVLAQIANQPLGAAEPVVDPGTTGVPETNAGVASAEVGAGAPATQSGAPATGALPTDAPAQSQTPAQPQIDPTAYQQAMQQAQAYQQLQRELQQLAYQRQVEEAQKAEQSRLAQRRDAIRAQAMNMAPEDAIAFIDRQFDQILVEQDRTRQEQINQQQQQFMATLTEATRPAYARHLAQANGLPPEYEQRLAMLPPQQMDQYLPVIKQEYEVAKKQREEYQALLAQVDQLRRSTQAQGIANTGAHNVGGVGGQPVVIDTDKIEKGTPEHLLSLAGELFGFTRSTQ